LTSIKSVEKQRRRSNSKGEAMSLWDIVAGISTSKQLNNDNKSFWKKFNSASVDLINGDGLAFTNEGGYTWNIFGANVNFVCDLEALIEGAIATKWHGHLAEGVLGAIFGPGANNNIVIGNSLTLNYMVGHSNNFTVMRGNPEISIKYFHGHLQSDVGEGYTSDPSKTSRWMWVAIAGFALLVAGFDIALNVMKNKINSEEETVHHDEAEIEKYKAIVEAEQQEAEAHGQVVNPDAGGTPAEPTHAQEELEHAQHKWHTDEGTLQKTETSYEWTIFSSILAENRGIWLLKFLEHLCAGVKTLKTELEDFTNTLARAEAVPDQVTEENRPSFLRDLSNIEKVLVQISSLAAVNPDLSPEIETGLKNQKTRARELKIQLKKKLHDYDVAARAGLQLVDAPILLANE